MLLCLGAVGCASKSSYNYASAELSGPDELPPAPMVDVSTAARSGGSSDYAYDAEYDFDDDLAENESMAMVLGDAPAPARKEYKRQERQANFKAKAKASAPASEPAPAKDEASQGEAPLSEGDDQSPDHGRQIIYTAGQQISVYDLDAAMAIVEALPDRFGGWVHMRNASQVVLRVPATHLAEVMTLVAELGVVEARSLQAQDVTAEYVDLESRIRVLRDTQTQLLELLAKSKTVEEALHVRQALDQVTMELEVALGRMRQLGDLIAFSTLTVTLVERGPQDAIPTSNDPFRWVDELGVEATEWR
ncbi:DUF4349 domain-containing protein [Pseudenhygromyxa sp. WMMC2535]|uniref:DUF4349 domain-containing protein n=1 Tax=Pseudenhygromyxa sp. WMMC2535 TaxID=2712867 RepID=UPI001552FFF5|nr:DUF4349 domain-containing protein [Pseudenhygromyxa sp. WMMC2535]NVB39181.1 DUF4349 domain-containing protein [Pseudenhygromyxa sp. WMMC2535]